MGVSLSELAVAMGAGDVDSLLTGQVSYRDLVQATIDVLNQRKPAGYAAAVTTLRSVLGVAGGIGAVRLGSLLNISPTDRAALATELNVLDLLAGSVLVADGSHALSIPNLQAGVPGVGNHFTGRIDIIASAQLACGKANSETARATNSQIVGDLGIELINLPSIHINAGLLKGTLQTGRGTGTLHVSLGNARSQLVDPPPVSCGAGTVADPTRFSVSVESGLAEYSLDAEVEVTGTVKIGVGPLAVTADVDVVVGLGSRGAERLGGDDRPARPAAQRPDAVPDRLHHRTAHLRRPGDPVGLGEGRAGQRRRELGDAGDRRDRRLAHHRQQQLRRQDPAPARGEHRLPADRARRPAARACAWAAPTCTPSRPPAVPRCWSADDPTARRSRTVKSSPFGHGRAGGVVLSPRGQERVFLPFRVSEDGKSMRCREGRIQVGSRRTDRGAAAVEFALVVPLLLLILFGIISYGVMLSFRQTMSQAATEGARAAAVTVVATDKQTEGYAAVDEALDSFGVTCAAGNLVKDGTDVGSCDVSAPGACTPAAAGDVECVTVTLSFDYRDHPIVPSFPGVGYVLPSTLTYSAQARVS